LASLAKGARNTVKKIAILPTLLTLGNAVGGFAALAWATKVDPANESTEHYFAISGWLIIAAMVCDALDGYVARLARSASKFGGELDSLSDAISFGAAPAFLLLRMGPGWEPRPFLHQILAAIAALYLVCTLLRLARFNVENTPDPAGHKRFRGLPSPGAAGCVASLAILRGDLMDMGLPLDLDYFRRVIEVWITLGALIIALLMVSRIPFPHVTKQVLRGRRPFSHLIQVILYGFVIVLLREWALVLLFWLYALGIPIHHTLLRSRRHEARPAPGMDDLLAH
jgi:CDP-diacylglycerol--serine O-phosphatidyltransferase